MTEAMWKWLDGVAHYTTPADEGLKHYDPDTLLRAFVAEVEKRTAELRKECKNPREAAFSLLTRELLGP